MDSFFRLSKRANEDTDSPIKRFGFHNMSSYLRFAKRSTGEERGQHPHADYVPFVLDDRSNDEIATMHYPDIVYNIL